MNSVIMHAKSNAFAVSLKTCFAFSQNVGVSFVLGHGIGVRFFAMLKITY